MALAEGAVTLGQLEDLAPEARDALLQPPDTLVAALPRLDLDATEAGRILRGQALQRDRAGETGLARIYGPDRAFLGVVEITSPGRILPRRLRAQARHIA
jgi:tRNA pseudouridine55 synthase